MSITFLWNEKDDCTTDIQTQEPTQEDFVDALVPPNRADHDDDIFLELSLVYLQNYSERSEKPTMAWGMEYLCTYQKVKGDEPQRI